MSPVYFLSRARFKKDQLGVIELKQNCTYVGVHAEIAEMLIEKQIIANLKKKVRISLI